MNDKLKFLIDTLDESEQSAIFTIIKSLEIAKRKHPKFANNSLMYCASIVAEEAGEFCRAINQQVYEDGDSINSGVEAAQIGAVAVRALCMLSNQASNKKLTDSSVDGKLRYLDRMATDLQKQTGIDDIAIIAVERQSLTFSKGEDQPGLQDLKWCSYLDEASRLLKGHLNSIPKKTTL